MAAVRAGRRRGLRGALPALLPAHQRLRARLPARRRPRRGRDAGGVRVGASAAAPDRRAHRLQAVDLRDRPQRVDRPLPAQRAARRRSRSTSTPAWRPPRWRGRLVRPRGPETLDARQASASTTCAARSTSCPTPTTGSSSCASSRASPIARSASGWSSAPAAVESTLFRARRKLEHEYSQLDTGRRCQLIRTVIATAGRGPGVRPRPAAAGPPRPPLLELPPRARVSWAWSRCFRAADDRRARGRGCCRCLPSFAGAPSTTSATSLARAPAPARMALPRRWWRLGRSASKRLPRLAARRPP